MKKLNRRFIKGTNRALAGILSSLGFSGCDSIGRDEYGCPHADYEFSGKVTNEKGEPVPNIQVKITEKYDNEFPLYGPDDPTRTGPTGKYEIRLNRATIADDRIHLIKQIKTKKKTELTEVIRQKRR
jgi:putative lipoprotein (rSAM/lipoprotein system)